jgi:hypothetical protein
MNLAAYDGIVWFLLMLGPLLILQRKLHLEIQSLFLILTRQPTVTITIFSILFLPGVALHEASHFLMARLLGVRTGRVSLLPRALKGGRLRMGYVETGSTDVVRDALIGAAPLLTGGLVVTYIGIIRMGLVPLGNDLLKGQFDLFWQGLAHLPLLPDFWLWFYLAFVVSSTMLPSPSDRRAWLPILVVAGVLVLLALAAGAGSWMAANLAPVFNQVLRTIAAVFAFSVAVHVVILLPVWLLRLLVSRITGLSVS